MSKPKYISLLLLILVHFHAQLSPEAKERSQSVEKTGAFATRQEFSKGGIGLLNEHLYVVVKTKKTDRNQLIVRSKSGAEEAWNGKRVTEPEVVFFYDDKVWPCIQALPDGFDLSRTIMVSFEKDKIRFFDFEKEYGAFYRRIWRAGGPPFAARYLLGGLPFAVFAKGGALR